MQFRACTEQESYNIIAMNGMDIRQREKGNSIIRHFNHKETRGLCIVFKTLLDKLRKVKVMSVAMDE